MKNNGWKDLADTPFFTGVLQNHRALVFVG